MLKFSSVILPTPSLFSVISAIVSNYQEHSIKIKKVRMKHQVQY